MAAALAFLAFVIVSLHVDADDRTVRWVGPSLATSPGTSCDRTGYTTIGAALSASVPGDEVRVCSGVYPESVVVDRAVAVVGQGGVAIHPSPGATGVDVVADDVTLERLEIAADRVVGQALRVINADGVRLRGIHIVNSTRNAAPEQLLGLLNSTNITIEQLRLSGAPGEAGGAGEAAAPFGLRAMDVSGLVIDGAHLSGIHHHNIEVVSSSDVTVNRADIRMTPYTESQAQACEAPACAYPQAIRFTGVTGAAVRNSTISGGLFGVHFSWVDDPDLDAGVSGVIQDNVIEHTLAGILIGKNGRAEVSGNRVSDSRFGIAIGWRPERRGQSSSAETRSWTTGPGSSSRGAQMA